MVNSKKIIDTGTFAGAHLIAAGVYAALVIVLPVIVMMAWLVLLMLVELFPIMDERGGPYKFPGLMLKILLYIIIAIFWGVASFGVSAGLQYLMRGRRLNWITPLVLMSVIPFSIGCLNNPNYPILAGFALSLPFAAYWTTLNCARVVLNWARATFEKLSRKKAPEYITISPR